MIYQKDWLMRQIESIIAAILNFLSHTAQGKEDTSEVTQIGNQEIDRFVSSGDICAAEDCLFENMDVTDPSWLLIAAHFYSEINKLSDTYLKEHNFSREEISSGLLYVCEQYGFQDII